MRPANREAVMRALDRHHRLVALRYLGAIVASDDPDIPPPAAPALPVPKQEAA